MSRRSVRVSPGAQRQIREAKRWWRQNRPAAPDALIVELQEAFDLLVERPFAGISVVDAELPGSRRLSLNRTHYYLYYFIRGHGVSVVALWHQRRGELPPLAEEG